MKFIFEMNVMSDSYEMQEHMSTDQHEAIKRTVLLLITIWFLSVKDRSIPVPVV